MVVLKWTYKTAKPEFKRRGFYLYEQEIRELSTIVKFFLFHLCISPD